MYQTVFLFLLSNIFSQSQLNQVKFTIGGVEMNMGQWLAHTTTIVTMCLLFAVACMFVKWLFKYVAGMFTGIGR